MAWTTVSTPTIGSAFINDIICVGEDNFVAVGTAGTVLTSADGGETWTARTAAAASDWVGLAFDGTTVVAVASSGATRVMVSADLGHTWTGKTAAAANTWASVTYASFLGMFIAVSLDGANRVMTSVDSGDTWASQSAASVDGWSGIASSPSLVVAIATSGAMMSSVNGTAWSAGATPTAFTQPISQGSNALVYSSVAGEFAAAGMDTGTLKAKVVLTPNGSSFTYSAGAPLTGYLAFFAFVAADGYGGFLGGLPLDDVGAPTPTIIAESDDAGGTWTAEDTTFSGTWQVGAWDEAGGNAVFWDGNQTDTMLVGTFVVASITPDEGMTSGGLSVTIVGDGTPFDPDATVSFGVYFGAFQEATNVVWVDADTITCDTPPFLPAGLVTVIVTNPDESTPLVLLSAFTYIEPAIDDSGGPGSFTMSPDHGPMAGGTVVTLTANGFLWSASPQVLFDGLPATSISGGGTAVLTCTTPAHLPETVDVRVLDS